MHNEQLIQKRGEKVVFGHCIEFGGFNWSDFAFSVIVQNDFHIWQ